MKDKDYTHCEECGRAFGFVYCEVRGRRSLCLACYSTVDKQGLLM